MSNKKFAFRLGIASVVVMLGMYLWILASLIWDSGYKGGWEGLLEGSLFTLVPALIALLALKIAQSRPELGGGMELIGGGAGIFIWACVFVANIRALGTMGASNVLLLSTSLIASLLLLASGWIFTYGNQKRLTS